MGWMLKQSLERMRCMQGVRHYSLSSDGTSLCQWCGGSLKKKVLSEKTCMEWFSTLWLKCEGSQCDRDSNHNPPFWPLPSSNWLCLTFPLIGATHHLELPLMGACHVDMYNSESHTYLWEMPPHMPHYNMLMACFGTFKWYEKGV